GLTNRYPRMSRYSRFEAWRARGCAKRIPKPQKNMTWNGWVGITTEMNGIRQIPSIAHSQLQTPVSTESVMQQFFQQVTARVLDSSIKANSLPLYMTSPTCTK